MKLKKMITKHSSRGEERKIRGVYGALWRFYHFLTDGLVTYMNSGRTFLRLQFIVDIKC